MLILLGVSPLSIYNQYTVGKNGDFNLYSRKYFTNGK